MKITLAKTERCELLTSYFYQMTADPAVTENMARAVIGIRESRFGGSWVGTMTVGGVGTDVPYRRRGCVRALLEDVLPRGRELGAAVSLLHPFSFSFYRQFGYERVSDTVIADFPIKALDFLPRYADLTLLTEADAPDMAALYERCMAHVNITFRRDTACFPVGGTRQVWLYRAPDGHLAGYITVEPQNHYDGVNRMDSDDLHVWEMVYEDADALRKLLSFLRMWDGELDTVRLHDIGLLPEVDLTLRHYMHTAYQIRPDIAARVMDTEALLRANTYPVQHGTFTLRVEDSLPDVRGTFRVEYQDGVAEVVRADSELTETDLTVGPTALARLLYGCDGADARLAGYLPDTRLHTDAADFFRAFPKRVNGLFEHF